MDVHMCNTTDCKPICWKNSDLKGSYVGTSNRNKVTCELCKGLIKAPGTKGKNGRGPQSG